MTTEEKAREERVRMMEERRRERVRREQEKAKEPPPIADFRRNPDGSWTTVKQTRVYNPAGWEIALRSNMTFRKGKGLVTMGFDLAEALEKLSKKPS